MDPVRSHLREVGGDANRDRRRYVRLHVVDAQGAELRIDDRTRPGRRRRNIETGGRYRARNRLALRVVGIECDRTTAIGEKVNLFTDPHRRVVVRILARNLYDARVGEVCDVDRRRLPAAVALPKRLPPKVWNVRDVCAVGCVGAGLGHRERQARRKPTGRGNREERVGIRRAHRSRPKEHAFAIRRPAHGHCGVGMRREPPRLAAVGRNDVDARNPVVRTAERNRRSVG